MLVGKNGRRFELANFRNDVSCASYFDNDGRVGRYVSSYGS